MHSLFAYLEQRSTKENKIFSHDNTLEENN